MEVERSEAPKDQDPVAPPVTSLKEYIWLGPRLVKLVLRLVRDPRVPARSKAALVVLIGYIFLPVDVIPDFIPGLGQLDELVLTAFALDQLLNRIPYEVVSEHWDGDEDILQVVREVLDLSTAFIPGWLKARFSRS